MDKELVFVFLPALSYILFALGGYRYKAIRRFGIPVCIFVFGMLRGVAFLPLSASCILLCAALHLGYGEKKSYFEKFLVGIAYAVALLPLGCSWWVAVIPLNFIILFILSNNKITENMFTWKVCEGLYGLAIGIAVSYKL